MVYQTGLRGNSGTLWRACEQFAAAIKQLELLYALGKKVLHNYSRGKKSAARVFPIRTAFYGLIKSSHTPLHGNARTRDENPNLRGSEAR